ncbi:hypothetical protein BDV93DRAFT_528576 [Ceratobasidium sp. AG-I]|nr:hypothetical protein BDV93DRAFT_528576 [Ceratobasidium sp. AG-I]
MSASATLKVFKSPELLSEICLHAPPKVCAVLLRVNKPLFNTAIRFVWSHVEGIVQLLRLIPGARYSHRESQMTLDIILPFYFSKIDFTRFELYAAHVKSLEIYQKIEDFINLSGWRTLAVRRRQPLLPALRFLSIRQKNPRITVHTAHMMWINTLIHPGVMSIRVAPDPGHWAPGIPYLVTSAILHSIDKACSHLQELTLYPATSATVGMERADEELYTLNLLDLEPLFHYFGALRYLRKLETSSLVLKSEILQVLGELPLLEYLAIRFLVGQLEAQPPRLQDNAFPALKTLALRQPSTDEAQLVLNLNQMLQNVTTFNSYMLLEEEEEDWVTSTFFPSLLHIPHLADLHVEFDYDTTPEIYDFLSISTPAVYSCLAKLPLRTVSLCGLRFDDVDFTTIFPTLAKLQLYHQHADASNIWCFTTIPTLEHLVLRLDLSLEYNTDPVNRGPACPSLRTLGIVPGSDLPTEPYWINQEAELLLDLWPNLQQLVWEDTPLDVSIEDPPVAFNAHLSMLRELRGIRARLVENCGSSLAEELMPKDFPSNAYKAFK